ncbi:MAG: AlpA family phage regulatory protein [Rhodoferax sp.]|nr:AlpA family phage regulatory protein [Rhodoferax sp.]
MSQPSQREPAFLRRKDVQLRTGLARSTIYLYIQQGAFPKPVSLGPRAVAGSVAISINDNPGHA